MQWFRSCHDAATSSATASALQLELPGFRETARATQHVHPEPGRGDAIVVSESTPDTPEIPTTTPSQRGRLNLLERPCSALDLEQPRQFAELRHFSDTLLWPVPSPPQRRSKRKPSESLHAKKIEGDHPSKSRGCI